MRSTLRSRKYDLCLHVVARCVFGHVVPQQAIGARSGIGSPRSTTDLLHCKSLKSPPAGCAGTSSPVRHCFVMSSISGLSLGDRSLDDSPNAAEVPAVKTCRIDVVLLSGDSAAYGLPDVRARFCRSSLQSRRSISVIVGWPGILRAAMMFD